MGTKPTAVQKSLQQQSHSVARNIADLERKAAEDEEYAKRLDAALNAADIAAKPAAVEAPPPAVDEAPPIMKRVDAELKQYRADRAWKLLRRKGRAGRLRILPPKALFELMADGTDLRIAGLQLGYNWNRKERKRIYALQEFKRGLAAARLRYWEQHGKLPPRAQSRKKLLGVNK